MTRLRGGAATHQGRVRNINQDAALVAEDAGLFAVADGMGGHAAGEVASQVALEAFRNTRPDHVADIVDGVRLANRAVFDRAEEVPEYRGMGTTLTAIALVHDEDEQDEIAVVNVGDSRAYLLKDGELSQLTEDHSLVEDMVRSGQMSKEEARVHPQRNIVTRVLGLERDVDVDSLQVTPYTGYRFLLCSDGLTNEVDEPRIASVLRRYDDPGEAADELVRLANEAGGRDNITVIVVDGAEDDGRAAKASALLAGDPGRPADDRTERHAGDITVTVPPVAPPPAPAAPAPEVEPAAEPAKPRGRRLTWRVLLFVFLVLVVLGAAVFAVGWYARGTYYVGFEGDEVTIYKGRPGGLLWFEATVEEGTGIDRDDVPAARVDDLEEGVEESSKAKADRYVDNLREQIDATDGPDRSTTTTTTRRTTTTTTP